MSISPLRWASNAAHEAKLGIDAAGKRFENVIARWQELPSKFNVIKVLDVIRYHGDPEQGEIRDDLELM